jgi:hypothetical protein
VFTDFVFERAVVSAVEDAPDGRVPLAQGGRMRPAAPNPFNPQTTVWFDLARDGFTELIVYDLTGRRVRTLVNTSLRSGEHRAVWDGRNDGGRRVASGVYLFQLRGDGYSETQRVALIK